jgi:hypothetical protein
MSDDNKAIASELPQAVSFIGSKPRSETVTLEWPVEYKGTVIDQITVRRLTTSEVAAYLENLNAARAAGEKLPRFPIFDQPDEVIDGLDDDAEKLNEVALRFLPRRFRAAAE